MKHFMLDLETLDTTPTAAIASIGLVHFYPDHGTLGPEFYCLVDGESCQRVGMTVGADTVGWWAQQGDSVRSILYDSQRLDIQNALLAVSTFLYVHGDYDENVLWGNGSIFDNVILRNAYERCNLEQPWKPKHDFCFRTMKKMFIVEEPPREGNFHNSLDDARHQARWLMKLLTKLDWEGHFNG